MSSSSIHIIEIDTILDIFISMKDYCSDNGYNLLDKKYVPFNDFISFCKSSTSNIIDTS